jgi:hypothetical protein
MKKKIVLIVGAVLCLTVLLQSQTHTFPAEDTNNVFTGTNQFTIGALVGPVPFVGLPAVTNGTFLYCSDCQSVTPCVGGGLGTLAVGINGVWGCSLGVGGTSVGNTGNPQYRSSAGGFAANTTTIIVDSTWSGADGGAKITSAEAALPSSGGIIDTSGFGCTQQTISSQLTIGADLKPVKWIKPACQQWLDKVTGGVSAIIFADGSGWEVIGGSPNSTRTTALSDIAVDPSANNDCVISSLHIDGTQESFYLDALSMIGGAGSTVSKGLVCVIGVGTNTRISNVYTQFAHAASALYVSAPNAVITNDVNFFNNNWDCTATCSGPVVNYVTAGTGQILGMNHFGDKMQHAGNGQSLWVMTGAAQAAIQSVVCWGCGFENIATVPTDSIQLTDTLNVSIISPIVTGATTTNFIHLLSHYGMFMLRDFNSLPNTVAVLDGLTGEVTTGNYIATWQSNGDYANAGSALNRFGGIQNANGQFVTLTDAASVAWNVRLNGTANAVVTLGGNRTLNLSNLYNGGSYVLEIIQGGAGSHTLALGTGCTWTVSGGGSGAISLTGTPGAVDILAFVYNGNSNICRATVTHNFN